VRIPIGAHQIDYEIRGPDDGRPVLFLHGLTADRRSLSVALDPWFEGSPGRWRRFYFDLPGHGASAGDATVASADELVATITAFARSACAGTPAVVAHSYGGYVAQGVARDLAATLPGMFLLCPVVEPDMGKRRLPPERVLVRDPQLVFESPQEQSTFAGETVLQTAEMLGRWRAAMDSGHRVQDHAFVAAMRARYVMSRPHHLGLAELACPVTIVCGRDDPWTGFEDPLALVRTIRDSTYVVLPRCGHLAHLEAAPQVEPLFRAWLGRL
jgi:pimeloyl-ACP methyl ester carboxylesterase